VSEFRGRSEQATTTRGIFWENNNMMDWFAQLPVVWMAVVVVFGIGAVTALIHVAVRTLAARGWTPAFKAISPVMLTPLAVVFGLIVGFLCAQVWSDTERANGAVIREAGALRTVLILAPTFPPQAETRIRAFVRRHIKDAVEQEWPAMAHQQATLASVTDADTETLQFVLALAPQGEAQATAQREMVSALRNALDARRERLIISRAKINWVKWTVVFLLGGLILVTIALVHSDNPRTSAIALTLFAMGMAGCVVLIASHNEPFTGEISVSPNLLLQVMPKD
jgi:hypothetical protein